MDAELGDRIERLEAKVFELERLDSRIHSLETDLSIAKGEAELLEATIDGNKMRADDHGEYIIALANAVRALGGSVQEPGSSAEGGSRSEQP